MKSIKEQNYIFCKKYPFWRNRNVWTGRCLGYESTWYDRIPEGWRIAFGKQMSDEILEAGNKYLKEHKDSSWKQILIWEDIKEKWGTLCLYATAIEPIEKILEKYEYLSNGYCIFCGKPAKYLLDGWVHYECEDCFEEQLSTAPYLKGITEDDKARYRKMYRLSEKDLPRPILYTEELIDVLEFETEAEADEHRKLLYTNDNNKNMTYYKEEETNDKYKIRCVKNVKHEIDLKKEYNIDLKELWGIK